MQEFNRLLGIEWPKGIVKFEALNCYAKRSYTTLKNKLKEQLNPLT